jgi:Heterokaryon incompatibility protein (HET)
MAEKCLDGHPKCQTTTGDPTLPSRVIDVGSSDLEMHLHVSSGAKAKYAALSYCWGLNSKQLTTQEATVEEHMKLIQFDDSSKTLQQAADVTRRLGLRYLWIDALCIIQDSKRDWEKESEKMSEVYHNATITISAAAAAAASQGLFPIPSDRERFNQVFEITAPGMNGKETQIRVRLRCDPPGSLTSMSHSAIPAERSPLSTRGWVLQESRLSPRILCFAKEEMFWLCSSHSRCECRIRPGSTQSNIFRQHNPLSESDERSAEDLYQEWPLLVMEFTTKDLTRESDRLHAISGLARSMEQRTSDVYLCGLWASNLNYDLVWFVHRDDDSEKPHTNHRMGGPYAPSWSWASVSGPITYFGQWMTQFGRQYPGFGGQKIDVYGHASKDSKRPLEIIDFTVMPCTQNKYGPVALASIQLSGHILPVKFCSATQTWKPSIIELQDFDPSRVEVKYDVESEIPQILSAANEDSFVFLFVAVTIFPGLGQLTTEQVVCMLLQRATETQAAFRRCGLAFKAGNDEVWYSSVPKSTIIIV